ncbi:MAG: hypothetical protein JW834_01890 [Candidatus Diapherotrites archaeon]|nr:hypothetical protein [Candidatus Diapherotrites archaeon]
MKRGQIFSTDLLLSLILIVATVGLVVTCFDSFQRQAVSTIDSAKMQQLAIDLAAIKHYRGLDGMKTLQKSLPEGMAAGSLVPTVPADAEAYCIKEVGAGSKEECELACVACEQDPESSECQACKQECEKELSELEELLKQCIKDLESKTEKETAAAEDPATLGADSCATSLRGSGSWPVGVFVCRGA